MDVLGIEDQDENDQLEVLCEFKESIVRTEGMRSIFFVFLEQSFETQMRHKKCLQNVDRKLSRNGKLREEYSGIIREQLRAGLKKDVFQNPMGEQVFYMSHKQVVAIAVSTEACMVFGTSLSYTH